MADFSPNTWYQISETRVGLSSALQYFGGVTVGFFSMNRSNNNDYWQILPHSSDTFSFRVENPGPYQQLSVCYVADEVDPSRTQPCLQDTDQNDPAQQWKMDAWGDGTWRISNVLNGTGYNLDCHPGNPVFLSSDTAPLPIQVAQHWIISSIGVIDNVYWSTSTSSSRMPTSTHIAPLTTTSSSKPTSSPDTATSSAQSPLTTGTESSISQTSAKTSISSTAPTSAKTLISSTAPIAPFELHSPSKTTITAASTSTSSPTSSHISSGTAVGIGVGVAVAVILIAVGLLLCVVFRRRRYRPQSPPPLPAQFNYPYSPVQIDGRERSAVYEVASTNSVKGFVYEAPAMERIAELDTGYQGHGRGLKAHEWYGGFAR